jgi:hypothetical protein
MNLRSTFLDPREQKEEYATYLKVAVIFEKNVIIYNKEYR